MSKGKINSRISKRRIIAINRDSTKIQKPKMFAHCLKIYLPKQITINPAQNLKVETVIQIVLPDNLVGILMLLPDIEAFKLKCQKTVIGSQKLCFDIINTSFDKKFIFKKNDLMRF